MNVNEARIKCGICGRMTTLSRMTRTHRGWICPDCDMRLVSEMRKMAGTPEGPGHSCRDKDIRLDEEGWKRIRFAGLVTLIVLLGVVALTLFLAFVPH